MKDLYTFSSKCSAGMRQNMSYGVVYDVFLVLLQMLQALAMQVWGQYHLNIHIRAAPPCGIIKMPHIVYY